MKILLRDRRRFIARCALWAALGPRAAWAGSAPAVPLLAREAAPDIDPAGYLVSEKFDGVRALWDGHVLRFRSGRPVSAPAAFVSRLPPVPLDGELWLGRGTFEQLCGLVRRARPDEAAWRELRYLVFEQPGGSGTFSERAARLARVAREVGWAQLEAVAQESVADRAALQGRLQEVLDAGGEGLMLHRADAAYAVGRGGALLKLKPVQDAEATVVAHLPGRGRLAGRTGALRVRDDAGLQFVLGSGLDDASRVEPPAVGSRVTYTYRGRTAAGVPRFASFLRLAGP